MSKAPGQISQSDAMRDSVHAVEPPAPTERRALLAGIGGLAAGALLVGARTAQAGPLDPPAGPVASTGKVLGEIEPRIAVNAVNTPGDTDSVFKITQPGSYYLTGDVVGTSGKGGIEIGANNVTIDLNGFTMRGAANTRSAISPTPGVVVVRTTIRNGSIVGWTFSGVQGGNGTVGQGDGMICEDLRVASCGSRGIDVAAGAVVRNCVVETTSDVGISTGVDALVESCSMRSATFTGIVVGLRSIVRDCRVNGTTGIGFSVGAGSVVSHCVAASNTSTGIFVDAACTVEACAATSNGADGIALTAGSSAFRNVCRGNAAGIRIFSGNADCRIEDNNLTTNVRGLHVQNSGNIIFRNTASGNTTSNWDIASNNVFGPIVDRSAPGSAAVNGNSAPDSSGSTHPFANFTY